ncbi:MAG: inositol monophosphatase [Pseudomonadota bacterium]
MALDNAQRRALIDAVRAAARQEIMPRFRALATDDIASKSNAHDMVTAADLGAEAMLRATLPEILPGARIIGEEGVAADPTELDALTEQGLKIILDPVDGTWNFARGLATFGTLLAVIDGEETVFGLLYDPVNDHWIEAIAGGGTWRVAGSSRIRCRVAAGACETTGLVGLHHAAGLSAPQWLACAALYPRFSKITATRASIWDYWLLVTGGADFCLNRYLNVWDHAAGALALREAGGYPALIDGRAYVPAMREGYLLAACSREAWQTAAGVFKPALDA